MKRWAAVLACLLAATTTVGDAAWAAVPPRANPLPPMAGAPSPRHNALPVFPAGLPAGCYFSGPLTAALPSAALSSVGLRYLGLTYTPPCDPAGVLKITLNLYRWDGHHWVFTSLSTVGVDADGKRISPGTLTVRCSPQTRVRAVVNYKVAATSITVTTNASRCS